jgi:hypothetical protein
MSSTWAWPPGWRALRAATFARWGRACWRCGACGLRTADVDFMRGVITPTVQYPAEPLKSDMSRQAIPVPRSLALELAAHVKRWPPDPASGSLQTGTDGGQLST